MSRAAHATSRCGACTGNTSSIASPNSSSRFATAKRTQGLAEIVPNSWPVAPASAPSSA